MAFDDIRKEYDSEKQGLSKMAEQFVTGLKKYHYFSHMRIRGRRISLSKPKFYQLKRLKKYNQFVLELEMHFKMEKPLSLKNQTVNWSVYDPTYFVGLMHDHADEVKIIGIVKPDCTKRLMNPNPSADIQLYAQSLDRDQKNSDGLGIEFAQQVQITCF